MSPKTETLKQSLMVVLPFGKYCLLFGWISALLVLAPTLYMFQVYDRVVNSRSVSTLVMLTILVLLLLTVMELLDWIRQQTWRQAGLHWERLLRPRLFQISYDASLAKQTQISSSIANDVRLIKEFISGPALAALIDAPVALIFILILFWLHPALASIALLGAFVQACLTWWGEQSTRAPLAQANQHSMASVAYAESSLRKAEVIAAMGMLTAIKQRWHGLHERFIADQSKASGAAAGFQAATRWVQTALSSAILGLGAWLLLAGMLPGGAGTAIVASVLGGRVLAPLVQLITQWRQVHTARTSWWRLSQAMEKWPCPQPVMPLPAPRGHLKVESLVVTAPGSSSPILRGIQFQLDPGELVAVIGPSGAGKSSLARALIGAWPCAQGHVRLDGADLHQWNKTQLGPYLAYIGQTIEPMSGTLADNIGRFQTIDPQALEQAIDAAGLQALVASLPLGVNTILGSGGVRLSGGQRQRVALAKAAFQWPRLWVLDEPNANLDDDGNTHLLQCLMRAKASGATLVVVSHRSDLLKVADKILILRDGIQQAFGPRDEVLGALRQAAQTRAQAPQIGGNL
jgi:ATP-binding cassette, subfamily C, bacterial exporter for protease/lipase